MHTIRSLLDTQASEGRRIGLIVDLCNHECLYGDDIPEDVAYEHIWCIAKKLPGNEDIEKFVTVVDAFLDEHPNQYVAVHCSYGFNRTGFMICCYLIQKKKLTIEEALERFKASRTPGIKHEKFKNELRGRYGHREHGGSKNSKSENDLSEEEKRQMEESLLSLDIQSGQDLLRKLKECKSSGKPMPRSGSQDSMRSLSSLESIQGELAAVSDWIGEVPPSSASQEQQDQQQQKEKRKKKKRGCTII